MAKYVEACGSTDTQNTSVVATGGLDKAVAIGAITSLFFAVTEQKFNNILSVKDKDDWDAAVKANQLIYLGDGKTEDSSTEASFAEDAALRLKAVSAPAVKSFNYIIGVCGCNTAELMKLKGRKGRLFMQTDKNILLGVYTETKEVVGFEASIEDITISIPTADAPWELTTLAITLNSYNSEVTSPARPVLEFKFRDVDQVYGAEGDVSGVSSNGTVLTATLKVTKDCTPEPLSGLLVADLKAVDGNGANLVIDSVTESGTTGSYTVTITTTETTAYLSTNGIIEKGSVLWFMETVTVSTT